MTSAYPTVAQLLRSYAIRPKKSWGQNFLLDNHLAEAIALVATTPPGGTVLEIGAGVGALTRPLLDRVERLVAVERDRQLVAVLQHLFGTRDELNVVEADALSLARAELLDSGPRPRVIAGNLPYAITGRLLERIIDLSTKVDRAVIMVQREVADRVCALPGNRTYGILSVFAQAVYAVDRERNVSPSVFRPKPKVGSSIVVLRPLTSPRAVPSEAFRQVVKSAFATRRKTLRNAWRNLGGWNKEQLENHARMAGVCLGARAETLAIEDFARMAEQLEASERFTAAKA